MEKTLLEKFFQQPEYSLSPFFTAWAPSVALQKKNDHLSLADAFDHAS